MPACVIRTFFAYFDCPVVDGFASVFEIVFHPLDVLRWIRTRPPLSAGRTTPENRTFWPELIVESLSLRLTENLTLSWAIALVVGGPVFATTWYRVFRSGLRENV